MLIFCHALHLQLKKQGEKIDNNHHIRFNRRRDNYNRTICHKEKNNCWKMAI